MHHATKSCVKSIQIIRKLARKKHTRRVSVVACRHGEPQFEANMRLVGGCYQRGNGCRATDFGSSDFPAFQSRCPFTVQGRVQIHFVTKNYFAQSRDVRNRVLEIGSKFWNFLFVVHVRFPLITCSSQQEASTRLGTQHLLRTLLPTFSSLLHIIVPGLVLDRNVFLIDVVCADRSLFAVKRMSLRNFAASFSGPPAHCISIARSSSYRDTEVVSSADFSRGSL